MEDESTLGHLEASSSCLRGAQPLDLPQSVMEPSRSVLSPRIFPPSRPGAQLVLRVPSLRLAAPADVQLGRDTPSLEAAGDLSALLVVPPPPATPGALQWRPDQGAHQCALSSAFPGECPGGEGIAAAARRSPLLEGEP